MAIKYKIIGAVCARTLVLLIAGVVATQFALAQEIVAPSSQATVRLEAEQQRKEGDLFFADGKVEIQYKNLKLRADHMQYNAKTYMAVANGNVQLDVETQHLEADSANFDVRSGEGRFEHVRGTVVMEHRPNAYVLVSPNPLTFEAQEVRRLDSSTYLIEHAWLTVCQPDQPYWKFFTPHATLHVNRSVALVNANFRLFRIPLLYMPYATAPAGNNLRQSGFLLPEFSDTSLKGIVLGDGYYWAPKNWTDLSIGGAYLSSRGWQQNGEFRAKPWENVSISAKYFGVIDRGLRRIGCVGIYGSGC
jgi:LPS-assembly protein